MNSDNREKLERWIDAYVDGRLSPADRASFERFMETHAAVRTAVEFQTRIDRSINNLFAPVVADESASDAAQVEASSNGRSRHKKTVQPRRLSRGVSWFLIASSIVIAATAVWQYAPWFNPSDEDLFPPLPRYTLAEAYNEAEKKQFVADWLCKNDKEFAQAFYSRLGQALAMASPPANIIPTGLSYVPLARSSTAQAVEFIAKVDGKGVIVFVDKTCMACEPNEVGPGLYVFSRQLGHLTLCEVSPWDKPHLLDLLSEREIPDDWKTGPTYGRQTGGATSPVEGGNAEPDSQNPKWKPPPP